MTGPRRVQPRWTQQEEQQLIEMAKGDMTAAEVARQLAQYAKRKFPDLNVIMVSGHGPPYVPHGTHFLQKPYPPQQLLDAVLK